MLNSMNSPGLTERPPPRLKSMAVLVKVTPVGAKVELASKLTESKAPAMSDKVKSSGEIRLPLNRQVSFTVEASTSRSHCPNGDSSGPKPSVTTKAWL